MNAQQVFDMAVQHHRAGRRAEAETIYRQILSQQPDQPDVLHLLGMLANETGRPDMAVDLLARAVALRPNLWEFHSNYGVALAGVGRLREALDEYQRALAINPKSFETYNRQGGALLQMGRTGEAIESFGRSVALNNKSVECLTNLASALMVDGRMNQAIECLRSALVLNTKNPMVCNNLGVALMQLHCFEEAISAFRKALSLAPNDVELGKALAAAEMEAGRVIESAASLDRAVAIEPQNAAVLSARLALMHFQPELDPQTILAAHARWGQLHGTPLRRLIVPPDHDRGPDRKLKIGYLSPDPRRHSVAFFLEPLLGAHDPSAVEAYFYTDIGLAEESPRSLNIHRARRRNLAKLSDAAAAQIVRNDQIDILVDLCGHNETSRLLLLARQPAPVQAAYLGYPTTTGLSTIEYRITDERSDPPGTTERFFSETLIRLPGFSHCFTPDADAPPPGPLPAESAGHITFGAFNRLAKMNAGVVSNYCKLLKKVPGSRLLVHGRGLTDRSSRERWTAQFVQHDISPDRLELIGWTPNRIDHLRILSRADIALDTFPCSGRATTCESLWMGVPVVTVSGPMSWNRAGAGMLSVAGLEKYIASTPAEQVARAVELAGDIASLREHRAGLREMVACSPLVDGRVLARGMESVYRRMWQTWCARAGGK